MNKNASIDPKQDVLVHSSVKEVYVIEEEKIFSQSILWHLQQRYFDERGMDAWRHDEVPHYATSNPRMADAYAEIIFSFWRERRALNIDGASHAAPLTICELGAGSGRFAFHFLTRIGRLCEQAAIAPQAFRYVLTDRTPANLLFWRSHPQFQTFFANGLLDMALFDLTDSEELALQISGDNIAAGDLSHPLVVIANYVFDSIPQDLFYFDQQTCQQCLVSLELDTDPVTLNDDELLKHVRCQYERKAVDAIVYDEPWLQQMIDVYRHALKHTYLLFPALGLRGLQRLSKLSTHGMLLLSADKGEHQLNALEGRPAPTLIHHGSFSLNVNYHAIGMYCEQNGGLALFPSTPHSNLNIGCCMMIENANQYHDTLRAFQRHVDEFSPDDFFSISRQSQRGIEEMSVEEILAYLRLSFYDSHLFARYLPRLMQLAPQLTIDKRHFVLQAVEQVWALYFPLGEEFDLANGIAELLYELNDYATALRYLEHSISIYGHHIGILYNMASCHYMLDDALAVKEILNQLLQLEPENLEAQALLDKVEENQIYVK